LASNRDKRFFGKMLNFIGLEETTEDDALFAEDDGYDQGYDEPYDQHDDRFDAGYDEPEPTVFARGAKTRRGREPQKPTVTDFRRSSSQEAPQETRASNVVGFASGGGGGGGGGTGGSKMKMIVYQPMTYDDTQNIIDNLKNRKPIIVNLESLETDIAQRILDFMSGAVYSLDGNIHKISKGIFILAPANVDISGNLPDELQGKSFHTLGNRPRREY
jgi:FtsZ-interacting cell division protein YlmF